MIIEAHRSLLLAIDLQERLTPAMTGLEPVLANAQVLLHAARETGVPVLATEQYPKGLGRTVGPVADLVAADDVLEKVEFSAAANPGVKQRIGDARRPDIVVFGIEAHVCVLQTVLDLRSAGRRVAVVRDACTSRQPDSAQAAYDRAARAGADVVTTEMVCFEWLRRAGTPAFKAVSQLIK